MKNKLLICLFVIAACKNSSDQTEQQMKQLNTQLDKLSEATEEKVAHLKWEGELHILLIKQGLKGKKLNHKLDSLCLSYFEGEEPDWHKKQRSERDSIELEYH